MEPRNPPPHLLSWRPSSILLVVGVWTALVAMSAANGVLLAHQDGRSADLGRIVTMRAIDWYSCAIFTPLFVWVARRWPIERSTLRSALPLWAVLIAIASPLKFAIQFQAMRLAFPREVPWAFGRLVVGGLVPEFIAFAAMAGVILSVEYHDRWREREVQASALHRQLSEARLEALTAQLQPHFLFNTLQSISTLLHRDTESADRMLGRLSELLRRTLHSAAAPEVPLAEELATLDQYLEIQRIRFQDRLRVQVAADGLGDALVPHLILQPLVENAIQHGIARRAGPGTVRIAATLDRGALVLTVQDDGADGGGTVATLSNGIGLSNTRARLATLYGDAAGLETHSGAHGFQVTLRLPLRRTRIVESA